MNQPTPARLQQPSSETARRCRSSALLAAVLLLAAACTTQASVNGQLLEFRSGTLEFTPAGVLAKGKLSEPATLAELPCRGWAHFREDGRLASTELASDTAIAGHTLPASTRVFFDAQGRLETIWLSRDTTLQGICWSGGAFKVALAFYPSGQVKAGFLSDDSVVGGVPCASSHFVPLELHEDGSLSSCKLAAVIERDGTSYAKGSRAWFAPDGKLLRATDP